MIHDLLKNKQVVLASASPRRKAIFDFLGVQVLQMPAHFHEPLFTDNPRKLVLSHAKDKCLHVSRQVDSGCVIIAADTIVYHQKKILEKPEDINEAYQLLRALSGSIHHVYSGIAIYFKHNLYTDFEKTKVEFSPISEADMTSYLETKEPFDKAGGYGIQGYGSQFIKNISGCYFNVMGFPVHTFYLLLQNIMEQK
jgi:septum formation protein